MKESSMKREFFMDADDLVDEILSALKTNGWTLSKMQYEMSRLIATCKEQREFEGKKADLNFTLTASWNDLGDALELEVHVTEPDHDWTEKDCMTKVSAVLGALKQEKTYDSLYAPQHGLVFDDFESNN